jgi:hypothetical protein
LLFAAKNRGDRSDSISRNEGRWEETETNILHAQISKQSPIALTREASSRHVHTLETHQSNLTQA